MNNTPTKNLIWYSKYHPKNLSDMILPKEYKSVFKYWIKKKEFPHVLLYGPPGGGKTTIANILMKKCCGKTRTFNSRSGIEVVKKEVVPFARGTMKNGKINGVFFDEANGLTSDAQEQLKTPLDKFMSICRFIFATNEFDKITDALVSRCQVFHFDSYPIKKMTDRIFEILEKEDIDFSEKKVGKVVERFYPDFRTIINKLQRACISGKFDPKSPAIAEMNTEKIGKLICKGNLLKIRQILTNTSDYTWLYRYLFNEWIVDNLKSKDCIEAVAIIADYMSRRGADKEIYVSACIAELMSMYGAKISFNGK